jgi:DNA polymerase
MVIGEAPGEEEDLRGEPFVGPAGKYLDRWLEAVGLSRERNVYIANIVKCRPPENRDPSPEETAACMPYLLRQVRIVRPESVLALGRVAAQNLLGTGEGIGRLRGRPGTWQGLPFLATYHPSAVLRDPQLRRPVWEDMKMLRDLTGGGIHPGVSPADQ